MVQISPKLFHISQHLVIIQHPLIRPLYILPSHVLLYEHVLVLALLCLVLEFGYEGAFDLLVDAELVGEVLGCDLHVYLDTLDLGYLLQFLHLELALGVGEGYLELVAALF